MHFYAQNSELEGALVCVCMPTWHDNPGVAIDFFQGDAISWPGPGGAP